MFTDVNMRVEVWHMTGVKIVAVVVTPVALKDPPLLNSSGVHEPYALRSIVEVQTDAGITGVS